MRFIKRFINKKIFLIIILIFSCRKPDKERPYVEIIFPPDGYVSPPKILKVKVKAFDNKDVEFVEIYLNDTIRFSKKYQPDSLNIYFFNLDFTNSPDSTYYSLKARAVDNSGNFSFSKQIKILITYENHPPLPPSLIFPLNNYTFKEKICTLIFKSFDPDNDTIFYDIYLSIDSPPSLYSQNYLDTIFIDTLEYSKKYYWKIKAIDKKGGENFSEIRKFKTPNENNSPYPPSNPFPLPFDTLVPLLPSFSWECSDPDGDSLYYDFYLDVNLSFENPIIFVKDLKNPNFTLPFSLLPGVYYYWKIVARDERGGENFSIWNFRTKKLIFDEVYSSGIFSRDLKIIGNYLYEIGGETKYFSLKIYNLINPSNPFLIKEINIEEIPWRIEGNENFIIIVLGSNGNKLKIFKRISPDSLIFLNSFNLRGWISEIRINNNSLFALDSKGILRIELTQTPYIYDSVKTLYEPIDFDLNKNGYLYILTSPSFIETYDFSLNLMDSKNFNINGSKNISFIDSGIVITTLNFSSDSIYLISILNNLPNEIVDKEKIKEGSNISEYFNPFLFLSMVSKFQIFTSIKKKIYTSSYPFDISKIYGIDYKENYIFLSSFSNKGLCILKVTE
jgi:hypothetical protein